MSSQLGVKSGACSMVKGSGGLLARSLKGISDIVTTPICPDLVAYRLTLRPILDKVIGSTQTVTRITIDRDKIFKQAISFYKSSRSNTHMHLMITFQTDGVDEDALDGGGVRREFYSTFFKECLNDANMFVGAKRRQMPSNDMTMVHDGYFEALGRAIVASILNGDCGFPYLAPVVFYYLIDEDPIPYLSLDDVPDAEIKILAEKLLAAETNDDVLAVVSSSEASVIDHIGWPSGQAFTMKTRDALVQQLVRWSILDKRKTSLDQLKQGLNHMGFLEATKKNALMVPLLVYSTNYKVTAEYVRNKVKSRVDALQCNDESQRSNKKFMLEFMKDMTDETAEALFQFITGTADPPVEEEPIHVEFNTFNKTRKFPEANTCSSKLWIPLGNKNFDEFRESMKCALENAKQGFGNA